MKTKTGVVSIVIVSYRVRFFLEQCLHSVAAAINGLDAEVIVIDNNSDDGSLEALAPAFPWVRFVQNTENTGYGAANNKAWRLSRGEFVLFLNPDTIIGESVIRAGLSAFEDASVGALGVRMIDGTGLFLPESKRGFPTPATSFFKMGGLIRMFPSNPTVGRYYLGHLPERQRSAVDVLSGAFMMVRREVLEGTGGFDERFFMYGEDVDLSYMIVKLGYRNLYLGDQTIIHFKGESTTKDARYVYHFYNAMELFVRKHYAKKTGLYSVLLSVAIAAKKRMAMGKARGIKPAEPAASAADAGYIVYGAKEDAARLKSAFPLEAGQGWEQTHQPLVLASVIGRRPSWPVLFCAGAAGFGDVIRLMDELRGDHKYRFHAVGSSAVIGSDSKNETGTIVKLLSGNA